MRNPLSSLLGNLELLLKEKLPGEIESMITTARMCAELIKQEINNILDTGKSEVGDLEFHPVNVAILDVISKAWKASCELIKAKGLYGELKISKNLPGILILDPHRITQVMLNLISNAIKFTDSGKISLRVDWLEGSEVNDKSFEPSPYVDSTEIEDVGEEGHVKSKGYWSLNTCQNKQSYIHASGVAAFAPKQSPGILRLIVEDYGCGMRPESLGRLFKAFSQVSEDANKRKIGSGLGLHITKKIINKMGGEIRVYSQFSKGSTFMVCIPTSSNENKEELDLIDAMKELSSKKLSALIYDPLPSDLESTYMSLNKINPDVVIQTSDTQTAYEKFITCFEHNRVLDIILLDADGNFEETKELCKKIRQFEKENQADPHLIVLTAKSAVDNPNLKNLLDIEGPYQVNQILLKPILSTYFYISLAKSIYIY